MTSRIFAAGKQEVSVVGGLEKHGAEILEPTIITLEFSRPGSSANPGSGNSVTWQLQKFLLWEFRAHGNSINFYSGNFLTWQLRKFLLRKFCDLATPEISTLEIL